MEQLQVTAAIDKLMVEIASKTLEYNETENKNDKIETRKRINLQLKDIAEEIVVLKKQLTGDTVN